MKKLLVTGDRHGFAEDRIRKVLRDLHKQGFGILVHGAAPGVDTTAADIGHDLGYEVRPYPADWARHHRAAGPIRNKHMLVMEMPDLVVSFHSDIEHSKGTADCLRQAVKMHIPTKEVKR